MDIHAFIEREVQNQGFKLDYEDGRERVEWMQDAWDYARALADFPPTLTDIRELGRFIEPGKNMDGFRIIGVQVGGRVCPPSFLILPGLSAILRAVGNLAPLELYKQFELIHPFEDGNGRVGKVLLNWWARTLDDPFMPPDLFGGGVP